MGKRKAKMSTSVEKKIKFIDSEPLIPETEELRQIIIYFILASYNKARKSWEIFPTKSWNAVPLISKAWRDSFDVVVAKHGNYDTLVAAVKTKRKDLITSFVFKEEQLIHSVIFNVHMTTLNFCDVDTLTVLFERFPMAQGKTPNLNASAKVYYAALNKVKDPAVVTQFLQCVDIEVARRICTLVVRTKSTQACMDGVAAYCMQRNTGGTIIGTKSLPVNDAFLFKYMLSKKDYAQATKYWTDAKESIQLPLKGNTMEWIAWMVENKQIRITEVHSLVVTFPDYDPNGAIGTIVLKSKLLCHTHADMECWFNMLLRGTHDAVFVQEFTSYDKKENISEQKLIDMMKRCMPECPESLRHLVNHFYFVNGECVATAAVKLCDYILKDVIKLIHTDVAEIVVTENFAVAALRDIIKLRWDNTILESLVTFMRKGFSKLKYTLKVDLLNRCVKNAAGSELLLGLFMMKQNGEPIPTESLIYNAVTFLSVQDLCLVDQYFTYPKELELLLYAMDGGQDYKLEHIASKTGFDLKEHIQLIANYYALLRSHKKGRPMAFVDKSIEAMFKEFAFGHLNHGIQTFPMCKSHFEKNRVNSDVVSDEDVIVHMFGNALPLIFALAGHNVQDGSDDEEPVVEEVN